MDAAREELSMSTARPSVGEDRLAKGLGWFSICLGLPQLLAPQQVNRLIGVTGTRRNQVITRAVGLRELAGAVGILRHPRPAGFLLARVAGDAMDLFLLRVALRAKGNARHRVAATAVAVTGVAVLDVIASAQTSASSQRPLTTIFRGLAGLRRARAFHPRGLMLAGELTTEEKSPLPLNTGVRPVIARVSKGVGTPGGAPDILGLAVRIPTENGLSRSWDLALSSSGSGAVLPATEANRVAFDPMTNHPPELRMSPRWLSRIRERAYQGSRAGRGASASPSSSGTG
jgi:hypothetical protein